MAQTPDDGKQQNARWRVWATRPQEQNATWLEKLQQVGFETLNLPLLEIKAVSEDAHIQALKNIILNFDEFNKVIFVSQNAVNHTVEWLDEYWPQYPVNIDYFAIGEKTAACAQQYGLANRHAAGAMNTDALLALPELQQVKDEKILICRGVGGLPRLGTALEERDAKIQYCELYERQLPSTAFEALKKQISQIEARDILVVFSGETLSNLVNILEQAKMIAHQNPLLVPGERVAKAAKALGFEQVIISENASDQTMLETLTRWIKTQ